MDITFVPGGILQIDNARIIWRNFEGRGDKFNREGDRNFALIIPNEDIKEKVLNDVNEYGVPWNVKIRQPREEGDEPFMYLKVKVKFNDYGPAVYLRSGKNKRKLDEDTVRILDNINIKSVNLDIRPYDDTGSYGPFRSAYLQAIEVIQDVDRFAHDDPDEEEPF